MLFALWSCLVASFFFCLNLEGDFINLVLVLTGVEHDQVVLARELLFFVVLLKQLLFQLLVLLLLDLLLH